MPTPDPDGERIAHSDVIEAWGKRWPDAAALLAALMIVSDDSEHLFIALGMIGFVQAANEARRARCGRPSADAEDAEDGHRAQAYQPGSDDAHDPDRCRSR